MSEYTDGYDDGRGAVYDELEKEITALREQLKDCSAAFDRQQEMLDRSAEQIATLQKKKPWVGLTDDEIKGCIEATIEITDCLLLDAVNAVIIDVETMLRRKNI